MPYAEQKIVAFGAKAWYTTLMKRYFSANEYFQKRFGRKVYKIALDAGFSCPNRENGKGGCSFCSEGGSGDFAETLSPDPNAAIKRAIARVGQKGAQAFVAYFQSYTNTYAPVEVLAQTFAPVLAHPTVVALSVATRPDCVSDEVVALLQKLNEQKPVMVELGLQTANDTTATLCNRGYPTSCYEKTMKKLTDAGIEVITHVIIGLPGETKQDVLRSVRLAATCNTKGIKLQLLHVLKNTALAATYEQGNYTPLTKEEYFALLADCLRVLPSHVVIHRLTGDPPKKILLAPTWCADKKRVLVDWERYMVQHDVVQGSHCQTKEF